MAERITFVFKEVADQKLEADVYYDPESSGSARPLALYFHGGSFIVGSRASIPKAHLNRLVKLGFVVATPDYRLFPTISVYEGPITDSSDFYKWAAKQLPQLMKKEIGVEIDPQRIVTLGHSCGGTLALLQAYQSPPPVAILDFYGFKYLENPAYYTPAAMLAKLPPFEKDFLDQVYQEVPPPVAAPLPFGPKGPDFSKPRGAFFLDQAKKGILFKTIAATSDLSKIDPAPLLTKNFPPTFFIHGTADTTVPAQFAEKAHQQLKSHGVESEIRLVEGAPHGFDAQSKEEDEKFATVAEGLKWLNSHTASN